MVLFRLLSAQLQTDGEHIKIAGRFHKDVWHTDAYGQNPTPFQRNPMLSPRQGPPYAWRPGILTWLANDALYPGRASFSLEVDLSFYPAQLVISGDIPANVPAPGDPPQVPLQATSSSTGGAILPGTYFIAFTPHGRRGPAPPLFTTVVVPAGTNTNTITVSGIVWPPAVMPSPAAFIGTSPLSLGYQRPGVAFTVASPDAYGNPTEYTFQGVVDDRGLPDVNFVSFTIAQTNIVHGGVWGNAIDSISGGNVLSFPLASWTVNQWQNYTLSLYFRPTVPGGSTVQPAGNVRVLSNTATTLTVDSGAGITAFNAGDVVVMRARPQSISPNTIGDPNFVNSFAPSGLEVNGDRGYLIQIVAGTGAWTAPKTIISNTATVHTISGTWDVTPDASSVYIVISPESLQSPTNAFTNDGTWTFGNVASVAAASNGAQSILLQVATTDADGNYFPMRYQPGREIYIPDQNTSASGPVTLGAVQVTY